MEDPFHLTPLWDALLAIYNEIARVCDKHGLRYYAADGTALGAMRHNGFIPWDDDLDLFMPRPDYERFQSLVSKEMPPYLKFVNHTNTGEFQRIFGKVQDCRREQVEAIEIATGRNLSNGLFVDIFPLDGYPVSFFSKLWLKVRTVALVQYHVFRNYSFCALPITGKVRWLLGLLVAPVCSIALVKITPLAALEAIHRRTAYDSSAYVGSYDCELSIFRKSPVKKSVFGAGVKHDFARQEIMLPSDCDAFLVNEYGDWRKLPPEEGRHPSHEYSERVPWWLGPTRK